MAPMNKLMHHTPSRPGFPALAAAASLALLATIACGHGPSELPDPPHLAAPSIVRSEAEAFALAREHGLGIADVPSPMIRADDGVVPVRVDDYIYLLTAEKRRLKARDGVTLRVHGELTPAPLAVVNFDLNRATITGHIADNERTLTWLTGMKLKGDGALVEGHTCLLGSDAWNQGLSKRRAIAVRQLFPHSERSKVTIATCAANRPADALDLARNRRAEIYAPGLIRVSALLTVNDGNGEAMLPGVPDEALLSNVSVQVTDGERPVHDIRVDYRGDTLERVRAVDVAVIVDTSGSMEKELPEIPGQIDEIRRSWNAAGLDTRVTVYHLRSKCTDRPHPDADSIDLCETTYRGQRKYPGHEEDWGPGTTRVAQAHPWRENALRIIIPISDELPYEGTTAGEPSGAGSPHERSIEEAIAAARANHVIVFPLNGDYEMAERADLVENYMQRLAEATGGIHQYYRNSDGLPAPMATVLDWISSSYLVSYVLEGPQPGPRKSEISIRATVATKNGPRPIASNTSVAYTLDLGQGSVPGPCDGPEAAEPAHTVPPPMITVMFPNPTPPPPTVVRREPVVHSPPTWHKR